MTSPGCRKPNCYAGEGLECDEGLAPGNCEHFRSRTATEEESAEAESGSRFFWTGDVLGLNDIARLAACRRVARFALIGPTDAGKTSFLATLYLSLLNGKPLDGHGFAGSLSIGAWEALAAKMRWVGNTEPGFPDHTPRGVARQPGLLHLALRDQADALVDVVFADAPGEWFERWAVDRQDPQAEGARWLEQHADAALVFLDSGQLSSPEGRGPARAQALQLLTRVADSYSERPWRALWAKHDRFEPNPATEVIERHLERLGAPRSLAAVSANVDTGTRGVLEATAWLLERARQDVPAKALVLETSSANPLFAFRGRG